MEQVSTFRANLFLKGKIRTITQYMYIWLTFSPFLNDKMMQLQLWRIFSSATLKDKPRLVSFEPDLTGHVTDSWPYRVFVIRPAHFRI